MVYNFQLPFVNVYVSFVAFCIAGAMENDGLKNDRPNTAGWKNGRAAGRRKIILLSHSITIQSTHSKERQMSITLAPTAVRPVVRSFHFSSPAVLSVVFHSGIFQRPCLAPRIRCAVYTISRIITSAHTLQCRGLQTRGGIGRQS